MNANRIKCPACGASDSESTKLIIKPSERSETVYCKCHNCKSFFNPNCNSLVDEVVHTKSTAWGAEESGKELSVYKQFMYDSILNLLSIHRPPPASLMDVGCSYAGFITQADKRGYKVYGTDILPTAVEYAKSLGYNVIQSSTVAEAVFNIPVFDVITVLDANYYFNDQPLELKLIHNKLDQNGILIMRVVDKSLFYSMGVLISKFFPKIGKKIAEKSVNDHLFSMPVSSLLKLLESTGYKILYASPKGAQHSEKSSLYVKLLFVLGHWAWVLTGRYIAPGCVIIAEKI
jgi:2-polyprenyl-3-methyl-5-hydroxy-6-metoxy-1,4-benzoquinol methylase